MCDEATILTRPARLTKFPVGTELSLRCRCRSSGTGTVRWIKNGATVRPVNGRISLDHRKLVINSTSFADSGNYTCYVTIDKLGTAKSNKLEIWGKYNLNIVSILIDHRPSCLLPLCQKESLWETVQVHFDANQIRFIWKVWHEYSSWNRGTSNSAMASLGLKKKKTLLTISMLFSSSNVKNLSPIETWWIVRKSCVEVKAQY